MSKSEPTAFKNPKSMALGALVEVVTLINHMAVVVLDEARRLFFLPLSLLLCFTRVPKFVFALVDCAVIIARPPLYGTVYALMPSYLVLAIALISRVGSKPVALSSIKPFRVRSYDAEM